jgi:hypothetical protein
VTPETEGILERVGGFKPHSTPLLFFFYLLCIVRILLPEGPLKNVIGLVWIGVAVVGISIAIGEEIRRRKLFEEIRAYFERRVEDRILIFRDHRISSWCWKSSDWKPYLASALQDAIEHRVQLDSESEKNLVGAFQKRIDGISKYSESETILPNFLKLILLQETLDRDSLYKLSNAWHHYKDLRPQIDEVLAKFPATEQMEDPAS